MIELGLSGKNALVLVSFKGIDKMCTKRLVEEEANVIICSRNEANLTVDQQKMNLLVRVVFQALNVTYGDVITFLVSY